MPCRGRTREFCAGTSPGNGEWKHGTAAQRPGRFCAGFARQGLRVGAGRQAGVDRAAGTSGARGAWRSFAPAEPSDRQRPALIGDEHPATHEARPNSAASTGPAASPTPRPSQARGPVQARDWRSAALTAQAGAAAQCSGKVLAPLLGTAEKRWSRYLVQQGSWYSGGVLPPLLDAAEKWCPGGGSNPQSRLREPGPEPGASANSATRARAIESGAEDSPVQLAGQAPASAGRRLREKVPACSLNRRSHRRRRRAPSEPSPRRRAACGRCRHARFGAAGAARCPRSSFP